MTLTHGDLRADNLFRKKEGGNAEHPFKFIDWQTYAAAAPGCDMCQVCADAEHSLSFQRRALQHSTL